MDNRYSRDTHYFSAVQLHQVLADPQSQARSAAALQIVAIELCELVEHLGLILDRYSYSAGGEISYYTKEKYSNT